MLAACREASRDKRGAGTKSAAKTAHGVAMERYSERASAAEIHRAAKIAAKQHWVTQHSMDIDA